MQLISRLIHLIFDYKSPFRLLVMRYNPHDSLEYYNMLAYLIFFYMTV